MDVASADGGVASRPARSSVKHLAFFVCATLGSVPVDVLVGLPASAEKRVVFFGDSITEAWVSTAPGFFYRQEDTFDHLKSMVELARAHGIHVVLASILPARDYSWSPGLRPARKIIALNTLLRAYAEKNGLVYLDYHAAMADAGGGLKASLGEDGVHPNRAGYDLMGPLAERALQKALAAK
jgi:lysophospholipase L1-like esterase